MSDRIFGGFGLALAIFYIWAASIIKDSFMVDVVGPRAFPYIVGTVLALTSIYFIARPDEEPKWPILRDMAEILFATAVMVLYALLLSDVGFVISTTFATAYLTWRLGTQPLWSLLVGLLTAVGIYVVFHLILGLALAEGPLGF
ncbi:tripartite tricarboxylate transporter TctB family protein [uncultured Litoreibacter sp.]|uniref:tripartite tricarboxylate transporter TctB family protein n=1 Tax=uncultured Litoreibacter sp. TaxID=1392394 RepID=UPI0026351352|nr:tripartite tricarboxylate transporter TctB family protein [uncultured Litoreibacter sp.]